MQLNNCHAFGLILSSPWAFDLGSIYTKVAVVVLFGLTVFVTAVTPGATFLTRLPKWFLMLVSTGLLISHAIFTFGSPLAGVIYWLSCSLAAAVLLPAALILLVTVSFRSQPPRSVVPQIGVCMLLGILCLITR